MIIQRMTDVFKQEYFNTADTVDAATDTAVDIARIEEMLQQAYRGTMLLKNSFDYSFQDTDRSEESGFRESFEKPAPARMPEYAAYHMVREALLHVSEDIFTMTYDFVYWATLRKNVERHMRSATEAPEHGYDQLLMFSGNAYVMLQSFLYLHINLPDDEMYQFSFQQPLWYRWYFLNRSSIIVMLWLAKHDVLFEIVQHFAYTVQRIPEDASSLTHEKIIYAYRVQLMYTVKKLFEQETFDPELPWEWQTTMAAGRFVELFAGDDSLQHVLNVLSNTARYRFSNGLLTVL